MIDANNFNEKGKLLQTFVSNISLFFFCQRRGLEQEEEMVNTIPEGIVRNDQGRMGSRRSKGEASGSSARVGG